MIFQSQDVRLLAEIGFFAASKGICNPANIIFESLKKIRPDEAFPFVGLAMSNLFIGDIVSAKRILSIGIKLIESEQKELVLYFALLLYLENNYDNAEILLEELIYSQKLHKNHLEMARSLLEKIKDNCILKKELNLVS